MLDELLLSEQRELQRPPTALWRSRYAATGLPALALGTSTAVLPDFGTFIGGFHNHRELVEPRVTDVAERAPRVARATRPGAIKDSAATPDTADSEDRKAAVLRWAAIVRLFGGEWFPTIVGQSTEHGVPLEVAITDWVETRATGTLKSRASSVELFARWLAASDVPPSLAEPVVYRYARSLADENAPPSRASAFLGAIGLACGTLGSPTQATLHSARVKGATLRSLKRRRPVERRPPLPMAVVISFEEALVQYVGGGPSEITLTDAVVLGFILFCVHTRFRTADAARIRVEPAMDVVDGEGYIEAPAEGLATKTGQAAKKCRLVLPAVGVATGLSGKAWAEAWLQARSLAGRRAAEDLTLLPTPLRHGDFGRSRATTGTVALWLRFLAKRVAGLSSEEVSRFGAHSMRVTFLSMMAKFGASLQSRRLLGGHVGSESSALVYSRDELAGPLREMERAFSLIRSNSFRPDEARSGRWKLAVPPHRPSELEALAPASVSEATASVADLAAEGEEEVQSIDPAEVLTAAPSGTSSLASSAGDTTSTASEDAELLDAERTTAGRPTVDDILEGARGDALLHVRLLTVHRSTDEGRKTGCGFDAGAAYIRAAAESFGQADLCRRRGCWM